MLSTTTLKKYRNYIEAGAIFLASILLIIGWLVTSTTYCEVQYYSYPEPTTCTPNYLYGDGICQVSDSSHSGGKWGSIIHGNYYPWASAGSITMQYGWGNSGMPLFACFFLSFWILIAIPHGLKAKIPVGSLRVLAYVDMILGLITYVVAMFGILALALIGCPKPVIYPGEEFSASQAWFWVLVLAMMLSGIALMWLGFVEVGKIKTEVLIMNSDERIPVMAPGVDQSGSVLD